VLSLTNYEFKRKDKVLGVGVNVYKINMNYFNSKNMICFWVIFDFESIEQLNINQFTKNKPYNKAPLLSFSMSIQSIKFN